MERFLFVLIHFIYMGEEVRKIMNKLNLFDVKDVSNRNDFYTFLGKDNKKRKVIFKMPRNKKAKIKKTFQHEYIITRVLGKNKKIFPFRCPVLIDGSLEPSLLWLLRLHIDGEVMGDYRGFSKGVINNIKPATFIKIIQSVQIDLPKFLFPKYLKYFQDLERHDFEWYFNFITDKCESVSNYNEAGLKMGVKEISKIKEVIKKHSVLLDERCECVSHGDAAPNNFLMNSKKEVTIFDWEQMCVDNLAADFAAVWINLGDNKKLQREFYNLFIKAQKNKRDAKNLFYISLLLLSLQWIDLELFYFHRSKYKNSPERQKIKDSFTRKMYKIFTKSLQKLIDS